MKSGSFYECIAVPELFPHTTLRIVQGISILMTRKKSILLSDGAISTATFAHDV